MTTLQAIDARLAKYRALIDELTALRAEVSDALPKVETFDAPVKAAPLGNSKPVARQISAPRANRGRAPVPGLADSRRLRIAGMLAAAPLSTAQIAERLPLASSQVSELMRDHPWFKKGTNRLSPWELTDAGRSAVTAANPV